MIGYLVISALIVSYMVIGLYIADRMGHGQRIFNVAAFIWATVTIATILWMIGQTQDGHAQFCIEQEQGQ